MTEFEDQLRADLEEIATFAPSTTLVRARLSSATAATPPPARPRLLPVLAAAAAVAAVSIGGAYVMQADRSGSDGRVPPLSEPTGGEIPDQATQRLVSDFVHQIKASYGADVYVATDWETATILVGAAPPIPSELERLDDTTVAGLRVDVFPADVTVSEFEAFMKAVDRATFPDKDRVCSFGLPEDSASIQVNVAALAQMSPDAVAALQAELESLTDARVFLSEARQGHLLGGVIDPSASPSETERCA